MDHYTSGGWINHLATQAIACGVEQSYIVKLIGVKPSALTSLLAKVPIEKAYLLFGLLHESNFQAKKELDLTISSIIPMLNGDIHGAYFNNSPDMKTFITRFTNMLELQTSSIRHEIELGTYTTRIYIDFIDNKAKFYVPQAAFLLFSLIANNIFMLGEKFSQQILIGITQPAIPDYGAFCHHVTDRICTLQSRAFIQIPTSMLEIKNPNFNPLLNHFIIAEYAKHYGITDKNDKLVTDIISHISTQWSGNRESISIEIVAKNIGMSRSKLYRELTQRNITFSEIVESQRKKFALDQIKNREMKIAEISDRLGYSNVSAFNRAFKRWFDTNPSALRS